MDRTYTKPLPAQDAGSRRYWQAAREHRLEIPRCLDCERHHFYPRELCPHCSSPRLEWSEVSGRGTIYSFTVARRPAGPAFRDEVPYVVALVELEEGPRMLSNVVGADPDSVAIGQPVRVVFEDVTEEVTLPKFEVVGAG